MILICGQSLLLLLCLVLLLPLGQRRQHGGHEVQTVPRGEVAIGRYFSISRLFISISISGISGLLGSEKTSQGKTEKWENKSTKNKAEKAEYHQVLNRSGIECKRRGSVTCNGVVTKSFFSFFITSHHTNTNGDTESDFQKVLHFDVLIYLSLLTD